MTVSCRSLGASVKQDLYRQILLARLRCIRIAPSRRQGLLEMLPRKVESVQHRPSRRPLRLRRAEPAEGTDMKTPHSSQRTFTMSTVPKIDA